jgi:hypothetical protein
MNTKTAKVYIKEDLNSTLMTLPTRLEEVSKDSFENISEIPKEEPEVEIEEIEKIIV